MVSHNEYLIWINALDKRRGELNPPYAISIWKSAISKKKHTNILNITHPSQNQEDTIAKTTKTLDWLSVC